MSEKKWTPPDEMVQRALDAFVTKLVTQTAVELTARIYEPMSNLSRAHYQAEMQRHRNAAMRAALEETMGELVELLHSARNAINQACAAAEFENVDDAMSEAARISDALARLRGEAEEAAS